MLSIPSQVGVPAAAALALLACTGAVAAQELTIHVVSSARDRAQQTCVEALVASASQQAPLKIRTVLHSSEDKEAGPVNAQRVVTLSDHEGREHLKNLLDVPFIFRDAGHFLLYSNSELARTLMASEFGNPYVAVAYGGFFHLFSRAAAVTEPSHFAGRAMGGSAHTYAYREFAGIPGPTLRRALLSTPDYDADAASMRRGPQAVDLMEAPLVNATALGLDKGARFLNLTFSRIHAIYFDFKDSSAPTPPDQRQRLLQWLRGAAAACSARNYQLERDQLGRLRDAGVTITPVDREAFAPAAWKFAITLSGPFRLWTLVELNVVSVMGASSPPKHLPFTLVGTLTAPERARLEEYDTKVLEERRSQ